MLDIVKDNLQSVLESIELIRSRFEEITHADDFVSTPEVTKLPWTLDLMLHAPQTKRVGGEKRKVIQHSRQPLPKR
jgi:hypothetical protein